jgi:formylmethanofuran dehydrogenase subunit B
MSPGADLPQAFDSVPCPFCGLLCDDLRVGVTNGQTSVLAKGCARSRTLFSADANTTPVARINGKPVTLERAYAHASDILKSAKDPALISAGTDVAGMRALIELAEYCGGTVDHVNSEAMFRNLRVLQNTGWIGTTLTEVRNRADLLVVAGSDLRSRFPRFFERCFGEAETLFDIGKRRLWFLDEVPNDLPEPLQQGAQGLGLAPARLAELFAALRALHAGRVLKELTPAGVPLAKLHALLDAMRAARYGVLAWAAGDLAFPHADLAVQSMCEFVNELNREQRFCVLPLGGSDGDLTAQQVTTWQTGFPVRVEFGTGSPAQHSHRNSVSARRENDEADAIIYVSGLDAARTPPASKCPSIVLGRAAMRAEGCTVFIPVSVPGLHHSGHLFRADNVVAIPLRRLAASTLPSAAQALQRILDTLKGPR